MKLRTYYFAKGETAVKVFALNMAAARQAIAPTDPSPGMLYTEREYARPGVAHDRTVIRTIQNDGDRCTAWGGDAPKGGPRSWLP